MLEAHLQIKLEPSCRISRLVLLADVQGFLQLGALSAKDLNLIVDLLKHG